MWDGSLQERNSFPCLFYTVLVCGLGICTPLRHELVCLVPVPIYNFIIGSGSLIFSRSRWIIPYAVFEVQRVWCRGATSRELGGGDCFSPACLATRWAACDTSLCLVLVPAPKFKTLVGLGGYVAVGCGRRTFSPSSRDERGRERTSTARRDPPIPTRSKAGAWIESTPG
jgi:hypothetical protein